MDLPSDHLTAPQSEGCTLEYADVFALKTDKLRITRLAEHTIREMTVHSVLAITTLCNQAE